jgi:hypothetical protein
VRPAPRRAVRYQQQQQQQQLGRARLGQLQQRQHVRPARSRLTVQARLTARGKAIAPDSITVKRSIGEGSYGQVFEVRWPEAVASTQFVPLF